VVDGNVIDGNVVGVGLAISLRERYIVLTDYGGIRPLVHRHQFGMSGDFFTVRYFRRSVG